MKYIVQLGLGLSLTLKLVYTPPIITSQTLRQQYLSRYRPDVDQTLNIRSWDYLQHIYNAMFVQAAFLLATFVHIRNISAVPNSILSKIF